MRHRYYYDGGPFDSATIHRDKNCSELEDAHPLADSTVESIDADRCPECMDAEAQSESESKESEESETCEVVKSDGEVCGRDLPCGYHSDD